MSKFLLASCVLMGIALCSCSDEQAQLEIGRLQAENQGLKAQVDSLQQVLETRKSQADSVKKSLDDLDMGI